MIWETEHMNRNRESNRGISNHNKNSILKMRKNPQKRNKIRLAAHHYSSFIIWSFVLNNVIEEMDPVLCEFCTFKLYFNVKSLPQTNLTTVKTNLYIKHKHMKQELKSEHYQCTQCEL